MITQFLTKDNSMFKHFLKILILLNLLFPVYLLSENDFVTISDNVVSSSTQSPIPGITVQCKKKLP